MKEAFIVKNFTATSLEIIDIVNSILDEYREQGFRLSLRQLYYQFVARDLFPDTRRWRWTGSKWARDPQGTKNADPNYKWIGGLVSDGRQAGLIDWEMIEDRGRETVIPSHWKSPAEIVDTAARSFRIDKWDNQPWHIEVVVEKDALSGVLEPVCRELDIGITANKGYSSSSTMYEIGKRLFDKADYGKNICVLYLGDHDPSGIDMTRDVEDRLSMYSTLDDITVVRLALNWDQIQMWRPPENPAKETDARYESYFEKYGESSWELDAVEPVQLAELVRSAVQYRLDEDIWNEAIEKEKQMRDELRRFADEYRSNHGREK